MKRSIGARTLVYPTPVFIVGTYDEKGRPNAMAASWGGICCSSPPCVSVSLRKATYTYHNLMERREFTISIPSENYVAEADYFGTTSGRDTDKFKATGLTAVKSDRVNAPYVKEFPLVLDCQLIFHKEIGLHTQFVGEILDVKMDEECMNDGNPNIELVKPFFYSPDNSTYYAAGKCLGKAFQLGKGLKKR